MKNATQNFPACNLLMNSADRFYPDRSSFVTNTEGRIDAPLTANQPGSWWGRSYNQGLPAVGGRYGFLRGAWLPGSSCPSYHASASWGASAPNSGEAC